MNARRNVTIDVGQVMFGQTVTFRPTCCASSSARLRHGRGNASSIDGDGNGGGIVPFDYREGILSALQWAIGLELFLLINDPWRVFFTTDHPNGAPFTGYPEIFELLMDAAMRERSGVASCRRGAGDCRRSPRSTREYTLERDRDR